MTETTVVCALEGRMLGECWCIINHRWIGFDLMTYNHPVWWAMDFHCQGKYCTVVFSFSNCRWSKETCYIKEKHPYNSATANEPLCYNQTIVINSLWDSTNTSISQLHHLKHKGRKRTRNWRHEANPSSVAICEPIPVRISRWACTTDRTAV